MKKLWIAILFASVAAIGCGSSSDGSGGSGGSAGSGGTAGMGGTAGSGGEAGSGGDAGSGGAAGMGGDAGSGGAAGMGGMAGDVVYEQDFEALGLVDPAALSGDGWLYFGNVAQGDGTPKFGFGPFAAPNGPQIVAVAENQGGAEQGAQQLNMYSNYECCQDNGPEGHFNGTDLVETIVFQEPYPQALPIPAELVGRTLTFSFDAKRGNINDPSGTSTAQAFIKTIDPSNQFATTNNVVVDTTSLPVEWGRYSVSLELTDPALEGQILQFGFQTVAKDFEPSANFYDNIVTVLE